APIAKSISRYTPGQGAKAARVRAVVENIAAAIRQPPWPGKGGATDRACLMALLTLASVLGNLTVIVSVRQLGELAGIDCARACRATHRLRDAGWIGLVKRGYGNRPNTYRIKERPCDTSATRSPMGAGGVIETVALVSHTHDAFRWRGLGKNGAVIDPLLSH